MFLKRIEMQGFKTFAEPLDMELIGKISAVVGPNGCGKSNIVDGIKWVLGEPNVRILRGNRLEDVIFAGNDRRRPVGMAEVSVTLDNATGILPLDYSEVRITRRAYRSGESEFLMNGAPCRLRDIQNLLQDTGLGSDSFAIIGQGKVESILNSRPEERRRLIEDAAGITRYLTQKKDALRKLDETENSLVRLEDLLRELEEQLDPLEEQARQARSYREKQTQYRKLEKELWLQEWYRQNLRLQRTRKNGDEAVKELEVQEKELNHLTEGLTSSRITGERAEEDWRQENEIYQAAQSLLERARMTVQVLQEKLFSLQRQQEETSVKQEENKQYLGEIRPQKAQIEARLTELKELIIQQEHELQEIEKRQEARHSGRQFEVDQLENLKSELIENLKTGAEKRNELKRLQLQEKQNERSIVHLMDERQVFLNRQKVLEAKYEELAVSIKAWEQRLHTVTQQKEAVRQQKAQLSRHYTQQQKMVAEIGDRARTAESRLQALREMEQAYEGYSRAVQELMRQKGKQSWGPGIKGVVAEVLRMPGRLEKALEVALGGAAQNLVVDTEKTAQEAIRFLKQGNYGRATFLPLDILRPPRVEIPPKSKFSGILGRAVELVDCTPEYRPVAELLLGKIWVAEDLSKALEWARHNNFYRRVVTLEGEVLNPGGALTGGSLPPRGTRFFSRRREIEDLEVKVRLERNNLLTQQQEKAALENKAQELAQRQEALEKEHHQLELTCSLAQKDSIQLEAEAKQVQERLQLMVFEEADLRENQVRGQAEIVGLQEQLLFLVEQEQEIREKQKFRQEKLKEQDIQARQEEKILLALREARASGKQQILGLEEKLTHLENEEVKRERELTELSVRVKEIEIEQDSIKKALAEEENTLERTTQQMIGLEEKITALRQLVQRQRETASRLEAEIAIQRSRLEQTQQRVHNLEVEYTRTEGEEQKWQERLWEEYQITKLQAEESIIQNLDETKKFNFSGTRQNLALLKQEMDALGTINLGAIGEFEKLRQRTCLLKEQKTDLYQAHRDLQIVISEIDTLITSRFQVNLEKIASEFNQVFQEMFGGGKAQLALTNPELALESGIEIIAQPPGKKMQNLMLLSGGERALTAIALLFGILKVRPAPLCILDEIESALDEVNVYRFASYLKRFTENTQFIVISHRKGTMEAAEALFGLTMEEKGVSKLVSVRLA